MGLRGGTVPALSQLTWETLEQGSSNLILEGRCPAKFSSSLPQHTYLEVSSIPKTLISCFRCVWLGLELNSAGHRPSRTELDPCTREIREQVGSLSVKRGEVKVRKQKNRGIGYRCCFLSLAVAPSQQYLQLHFPQLLKSPMCFHLNPELLRL